MSGIKVAIALVVKWCVRLLLGFIALSIAAVILFRFVPLPLSMVMAERQVSAWIHHDPFDLQYEWTPYNKLSANAKLAVIASEDQRFPFHHGFDTRQIRKSIDAWLSGDPLRGASTISQQTARNVFLWTERSWLRKGLEVWFTALIEVAWPKERILEVYLNVAEWDTGVFGLEAASRHYFGQPAGRLTIVQASRLAAVLPAPRDWSPVSPSARVQGRARWIRQQMNQLGGTLYLERLDE